MRPWLPFLLAASVMGPVVPSMAASPPASNAEARLAADWAVRMADVPRKGLPRLADPSDGDLVKAVFDRSRFRDLKAGDADALRGYLGVCASASAPLRAYLGWSVADAAPDTLANEARFSPEVAAGASYLLSCFGGLASATKALLASEPPGAISEGRRQGLAKMVEGDVQILRMVGGMVLNPAFSAGERATLVSAVVEAAPEIADGASDADRDAVTGILKGLAEAAPDEASRSAISAMGILAR